jgi:putative addiction module component (TIGR02574 family)
MKEEGASGETSLATLDGVDPHARSVSPWMGRRAAFFKKNWLRTRSGSRADKPQKTYYTALIMLQAAEILDAALKLDEPERAQLVEALSESLYGRHLGDEWEAEIERRIEDVDSGRVKPVPGGEVFGRLEKRFGAR